MNTYLCYLYRDVSNYKTWNEVILSGCLTPNQKSDIITVLNEGLYFIPEQIGLPVERFGKITEDDHCWCELELEDINDTDLPPTIEMTAKELYENFMELDGRWDDVTYAVIEEGKGFTFEIWQDGCCIHEDHYYENDTEEDARADAEEYVADLIEDQGGEFEDFEIRIFFDGEEI